MGDFKCQKKDIRLIISSVESHHINQRFIYLCLLYGQINIEQNPNTFLGVYYRSVTAVTDILMIRRRSTIVELAVRDSVMSVLSILNLYLREDGDLALYVCVKHATINLLTLILTVRCLKKNSVYL